MDLICLSEEAAPKAGVSLTCFPLGLNKTLQTVTPTQVTSLRLDVFTCGQVTAACAATAQADIMNDLKEELRKIVEYLLPIRPSKMQMSLFLHQIWRNVAFHQMLCSEWVPSQ